VVDFYRPSPKTATRRLLDFFRAGLNLGWNPTKDTPMKTAQELRTGSIGQVAKFLGDPKNQYDAEHLQAAMWNALREINRLKQKVAQLQGQSANQS
jgi:hypothetical protein